MSARSANACDMAILHAFAVRPACLLPLRVDNWEGDPGEAQISQGGGAATGNTGASS